MNSTTALWLACFAALIHLLVGALQSNSFNSLLAQFGIPAISIKAFPYIGLVLGLAGGVVTGLQQGLTIGAAIATAVLGVLSGGASAMHAGAMGRIEIPAPAKPVVVTNQIQPTITEKK